MQPRHAALLGSTTTHPFDAPGRLSRDPLILCGGWEQRHRWPDPESPTSLQGLPTGVLHAVPLSVTGDWRRAYVYAARLRLYPDEYPASP